MDATHESAAVPELAPDGSTVRPLLTVPDRGSLATFALAAGRVSAPVQHRRVVELWYVLSGVGQLWRAPASLLTLTPGVCATIPAGVPFQFRAATALRILAVTMPPWPGPPEAVPATGPWSADLSG